MKTDYMMKRTLMMLAAILCCTLTIGAQVTASKMSPWLKEQYKQHQKAVQKNGGPLRAKGRPVRNYILTLVQSSDDARTIHQKGGVVWQDFGDGICAAFLPMDSLDVLEQAPSILRMEANASSQLQNDTSAVILGVDKAWDFESTLNSQPFTPNSSMPQAFTGKGVIAAIMDVGFDFTHPAFRNEDGTSRIQWFWDPLAENNDSNALGVIYDSPEKVLAAQHSSDAEEKNHGTHVLSSMAGDGLNGRYIGMAPESDIIGAHLPLGNISDEFLNSVRRYIISHFEEDLTDAFLSVDLANTVDLVELYRIFERADAAGQPCVVNCSFGTPNNFNADFTLYEQVLNQMLGPGRIVVAAAGNDGDYYTYLKKEAGTPLNQDIYWSTTGNDYFYIFMRTMPDEPFFDFTLEFDGIEEGLTMNTEIIYEASLDNHRIQCETDELQIVMGLSYGAYRMPVYLIVVKPIGKYASSIRKGNNMSVHGKILVGSDPQVELMGGSNSNYVLFSEETYENSRGCHQGTLSTPACLERPIAAGGMHHRSYITNVEGGHKTYIPLGSQEGQLMSFSSCGPTLDGRIKPDVVAPGHNIISALNSFYRNGSDEETEAEVSRLLAYKTNDLGKDYGMWAMSGTSMASPITAGVIALWLQAKPDLTPEDIKGVIARTSHQPEPEFSGTDKNVYYGWGEIDAYAGLLDILGLSTSIPELSTHQPGGMKFRLQGHTLYIDGANEGTPIHIYATDGRLVKSTSISSGSVSLPAGSPAGVYAVQVGKLGSTLIRL